MTRVPITDQIREELNYLRKKSGKGGMRLLRGRKDIPQGLDSAMIQSWLNGATKVALKSHINYVRKAWKTTDPKIPVTPEMVEQLNSELERTGMSPTSLLRACPDLQSKIANDAISALRCGARKTVDKTIWNEIITSLRRLPDKHIVTKKPYLGRSAGAKGTAPPKKPYLKRFPDDHRPLTKTEIEQLKQQRERTGVGATALLRLFAAQKPDKLSANIISGWINGSIQKASKSRLVWVTKKWASLPDRTKRK
jgi:hypothetical protein